MITPAPGKRTKGPRRDLRRDGLEAALATARSILDKHDAIRVLNEESENLKKEALRLHDWQGVSLSDLRAIRDQGYEIRFFEVPPKQLGLIPPGLNAFVVKRTRTLLWVALVLKAGTPLDLQFKPLDPPRRGAAELEELQAENRSDLRSSAGNWTSWAPRPATWSVPSMPPPGRSSWPKRRRPWAIPKRSHTWPGFCRAIRSNA